MWWLIMAGVMECAAVGTSILLLRRRLRNTAYMLLMLAELLPVEVAARLSLPSSATLLRHVRIIFVGVCLLVWVITILLYFLKHPERSRLRRHGDQM